MEAKDILGHLKDAKMEYDYGGTDYELARYHAAIGNPEQALKLLTASIADGNIYTTRRFQNDPVFKSIINTSQFEKIMTYWH